MRLQTLSLAALALLVTLPAAAQQAPAGQEVGRRFHIKPQDLPQPGATPSVTNAPIILPAHDHAAPQVPEGFTAAPFVIGLAHPRRLLALPNGDIIVAEQKVGYLTLLRDSDGDGKADFIQRHAENFQAPYGLAWRDDGHILVADQNGIWQVPHKLGNVRASGTGPKPAAEVKPEERKPDYNAAGQKMVTAKGVFGEVLGHQNRPMAVDPATGSLFVGVGSAGNIGVEPPVKATIQRFDASGGGQETFVSGVRNPTGMAVQPGTGDLYALIQERDGLGDGLVPDFLIRVRKGDFYGYPYAYIGPNPQPGFANLAPDKVKATVVPELLFEAHSSALDIVFYEGAQFPDAYRGSAFVALKGSWNSSVPTGYKVVRVPFKDGKPEGWYENFVTGFWASGEQRAEVWARPAALAVTKDGALLVADDTNGTIWRVAYTGKPK